MSDLDPGEALAADLTREQGWTDAPVRVVEYDPSWPERFELERRALQAALGERVSGGIHHVGSTAVPGLQAKPIIDLLVGVRDTERARACFPGIAALGYLYAPYRIGEMDWFCKPHPSRRTHHLHLVHTDHPRFADELLFRDYLREHHEAAIAYAQLKLRLAREHETDREAYGEAKGDFIRAALAAARR